MTCPPAIGSAQWDEELLPVGISGQLISALVRVVLYRQKKVEGSVNVHGLRFTSWGLQTPDPFEYFDPDDPDLEQFWADLPVRDREYRSELIEYFAQREEGDHRWLEVAAWLVFHEDHPEYAPLMSARFALGDIDLRHPLRAWHTRQLAAKIIHGDATIRDSVEYHLGVDAFEVVEESKVVFPLLVDLLPTTHYDVLLGTQVDPRRSARRDHRSPQRRPARTARHRHPLLPRG